MISLDCLHCSSSLMTAAPRIGQSASAFQAAWKANVARRLDVLRCVCCEGAFFIVDDGVDVSSGGTVCLRDRSAPLISSLNVSSGPRTGGGALFITGSSLDIGDLVVKFGGKLATLVDSRTATSARVIVPPATYKLNVVEICHKLTLTVFYGALALGEAITSAAGSTGVIRRIDGNTYVVAFASIAESLEDMIGANVTGSSGATARIGAAALPIFSAGESITGLTSSARATIRDTSSMIVDSPTGGFAPNELIQGTSSGAIAKLSGSPAYSGLVDVAVENEYGQRVNNSVLVGAYTYA